ncbi:MAG: type II toxin-antitoxin system Phd/YefM family antitoxin [Candidatus Faecousia sp.]|nr:type II toxin-antitoxin system Phd/YefM family antitoxin [Candidatus Faecousia sp.]
MIHIRPVSDLRNKFPEIEALVQQSGEPVYLTKNGYGSMVLMSIEQFSALTDSLERRLDEADRIAEADSTRCTADEVFDRVRKRIHGE